MPLNGKNKLRAISSVTPSGRDSAHRNSKKSNPSTVQFLHDRYVGKDPERNKEYEREVLNAAIARQIFELRNKCGLSQRELAARVGTSASAICRLEDADYEGHSLSLLKRIAEALGTHVEIRFATSKESTPRRSVAVRKKAKS